MLLKKAFSKLFETYAEQEYNKLSPEQQRVCDQAAKAPATGRHVAAAVAKFREIYPITALPQNGQKDITINFPLDKKTREVMGVPFTEITFIFFVNEEFTLKPQVRVDYTTGNGGNVVNLFNDDAKGVRDGAIMFGMLCPQYDEATNNLTVAGSPTP